MPVRSDGRNTKLTWEQVDEIRHLYKMTDLTKKAIGQRYGVTGNAIRFIVDETHWRPEIDPRRKA